MEPEGLEDPFDKLQNALKVITKWLLYCSLILCILGAFFWGLFYWQKIANNTAVITARNFYQDVYLKTENLISPQKTSIQIYNIQAQQPQKANLYTYTASGTFFSLDATKGIMSLVSSGGNIYTFDVSTFIYKDASDSWLKIYQTTSIDQLSDATISEQTDSGSEIHNLLPNARLIAINGNQLAVKPENVVIRWNDSRNLDQIESDYSNNTSAPLNSNLPEDTILAELKQ